MYRSVSCMIICLFFLHSCDQESGSFPGKDAPIASIDSSSTGQLGIQLRFYPDSPALRLRYAGSLEKEGNIIAAKLELDTLVVMDSASAFLRYRRAQILLKSGDTLHAIDDLKMASLLDPGRSGVILELGNIYADQKDARVLSLADTLISRTADPDMQSRGLLLKGIYYSNTGNKSMALKQYEESINHNYTFIDAFIEKGIVLYELRRYPEALKTFQRGLNVKSTHAELYLWSAKCLQAMGRKEEALDSYRKSLGLDDQLTEAHEAIRLLEAK